MAGATDRRRREIHAAIEQTEDLFALDVEEGNEVEEYDRASRLQKSPLHLLLMIQSDDLPLSEGMSLHYDVSKNDPRTIVVVERYDRIRIPNGSVYNSLSTAIQHAQQRKSADGWEAAKIDHPAKPGKYVSLNTIFMDNWRRLGPELDVLEDTERLARWLAEHGRISAEEAKSYERKPKAAAETRKR